MSADITGECICLNGMGSILSQNNPEPFYVECACSLSVSVSVIWSR